MKIKEIFNVIILIATICLGFYFSFYADIPVPNALGCLLMTFMAMSIGILWIGVSIRDYFRKIKKA